jgi:hypothetical protein
MMTIHEEAISVSGSKFLSLIPPGGIDADPFVRNSRCDGDDRGVPRLFITSIGAIHSRSAQARPRFAEAAGRALSARGFLP